MVVVGELANTTQKADGQLQLTADHEYSTAFVFRETWQNGKKGEENGESPPLKRNAETKLSANQTCLTRGEIPWHRN